MKGARRRRLRHLLLLGLLLAACEAGGAAADAGAVTGAVPDGAAAADAVADAAAEDAPEDTAADTAAPDAGTPAALRRVATQNAGTSEFLNVLVSSPRRADCSEWYDNNLCTTESEAALAARIAEARPDVLMLEEVWDQRRCAAADRPPALNEAPYACSAGATPQPERLLPADYDYGCAAGYPDNCIAWRRGLFAPAAPDGAPCAGRDCGAAVVSNAAPCGRDGRVAFIRGHAGATPTVLAVVHTNAGVDSADRACRAAQLDALGAALVDEPPGTQLVVAGDFNFDPATTTGEEKEAFDALLAALDLVRLADDGGTHRILQQDLDLVLVSPALAADRAPCHVAFVDAAAEVPMFDHAFVDCK